MVGLLCCIGKTSLPCVNRTTELDGTDRGSGVRCPISLLVFTDPWPPGTAESFVSPAALTSTAHPEPVPSKALLFKDVLQTGQNNISHRTSLVSIHSLSSGLDVCTEILYMRPGAGPQHGPIFPHVWWWMTWDTGSPKVKNESQNDLEVWKVWATSELQTKPLFVLVYNALSPTEEDHADIFPYT